MGQAVAAVQDNADTITGKRFLPQNSQDAMGDLGGIATGGLTTTGGYLQKQIPGMPGPGQASAVPNPDTDPATADQMNQAILNQARRSRGLASSMINGAQGPGGPVTVSTRTLLGA